MPSPAVTSLKCPVWIGLNFVSVAGPTSLESSFVVNGRCGERRSPKVQPSTRPGIKPGTFWLAVRDLTNCANLAHKFLKFQVIIHF